MQFANKHVFITGGSEGLGLALAKQLVASNARVTLVGRTASKLEAAQTVVAACCSSGNAQQPSSHVYCHAADVTKYQQVSTRAPGCSCVLSCLLSQRVSPVVGAHVTAHTRDASKSPVRPDLLLNDSYACCCCWCCSWCCRSFRLCRQQRQHMAPWMC